MMRRTMLLAVTAFAVAIWAAGPAIAEEGKSHEGKVVKVEEGKLTMTDKDGKEHSHAVAKDAKITKDGKEHKLAELEKGTRIKVTVVEKDGKEWVTKIESLKAE